MNKRTLPASCPHGEPTFSFRSVAILVLSPFLTQLYSLFRCLVFGEHYTREGGAPLIVASAAVATAEPSHPSATPRVNNSHLTRIQPNESSRTRGGRWCL